MIWLASSQSSVEVVGKGWWAQGPPLGTSWPVTARQAKCWQIGDQHLLMVPHSLTWMLLVYIAFLASSAHFIVKSSNVLRLYLQWQIATC